MPTLITDTVPLWVEHLRAKGLSPDYIDSQRNVITGPSRGFLGVVQRVKGARPTTGQIDNLCVDRYLAAHEGNQGSRANKLIALKSYFSYLENRGLLRPGLTTAKLLDGYKGKREQRQPKYYIPADDFTALLAVAHDPRDRAVLALGLFTLARQSEIANLRLSDLGDKAVQVYRFKRRRHTASPVGRELKSEMETWLKAYAAKQGYADPSEMIGEHPDWYLVPAKHTNGYGWNPKPEVAITGMEGIVKLALTDLGVTDTRSGSKVAHLGEGMHTIRRSGARALFKRLVKAGGQQYALSMVQSMLDHESSDMTMRYIGLDWIKEQLDELIQEGGMYE